MKNLPLHFFIFAGEQSGDLHGRNLIKALKCLFPEVHISGVGGPEMRSQGIHSILRMEDFEVMGFSDVLFSLPKLCKQFYLIRNYILDKQPSVVILIDYPGFNLRMAQALRKKGFKGKIVQYICPTVWAWGKNRIQKMTNTLDLLLTIYPFEAKIFDGLSLRVEYIGNPLFESIQNHQYQDHWREIVGLKKSDTFIAIFPGSRKGEIRRNLPIQLEAASFLKEFNPNICFAVSSAHDEVMSVMRELLEQNSLKINRDIFFVPKAYTYELMRDAHTAIAKSGTVTLELALHQRPTVVVYKLSILNRFVAKYLMRIKLPNYCITNILGEKRIFPELIESGFNSKNLFQNTKILSESGDIRNNCIQECTKIYSLLKNSESSSRAASAIKSLLHVKDS
jgi:lipid-A-disaccharide synthase